MSNTENQTTVKTSLREEAHWNSFRDAVASLQNILVQVLEDQPSEENDSDSHLGQHVPQFDFSGIEKVKESARNTINLGTNMMSPLHQDPNVSQAAASHVASEALSVAEQKLAEMKLQLALTQSERDELEFEFMRLKR
jgi:hypothetical protein